MSVRWPRVFAVCVALGVCVATPDAQATRLGEFELRVRGVSTGQPEAGRARPVGGLLVGAGFAYEPLPSVFIGLMLDVGMASSATFPVIRRDSVSGVVGVGLFARWAPDPLEMPFAPYVSLSFDAFAGSPGTLSGFNVEGGVGLRTWDGAPLRVGVLAGYGMGPGFVTPTVGAAVTQVF